MRRAKPTTRNAGKRNLSRSTKASSGAVHTQWTDVAYDVTSIDRDLEMLLARLRLTEGCTREEANAALVRRLSFAA